MNDQELEFPCPMCGVEGRLRMRTWSEAIPTSASTLRSPCFARHVDGSRPTSSRRMVTSHAPLPFRWSLRRI